MKLFITNLPYVFSESDLRGLLEKHCTIIYLKIMMDRKNGHSSGRAFVQVETQTQGKFIIAALDGFKVKGRPMYVAEAHEQNSQQAILKSRHK